MATPLVIACGALTGELRAVLDANGMTDDIEVRYLPANLHNRPERIVPALREELQLHGSADRPILIGYADCGTGGLLDALIDEMPHLRRLPGAHCYETFAGSTLFAELHDEEPGTFYLTDFLARHFDALVWQGLGLDDHPELHQLYFANYRRVVLLSQSEDPAVLQAAVAAAERLGLELEHRHVGRTGLESAVVVTLGRVG
ncbi:MAG: DUF1638 domain-containing protein [Acidimicrobiia bacterium]